MKSVVIIPTYNEKDNVGRLVKKLIGVFKKLPNWKIDILVVDDSSPDGTADVVKTLARNKKTIHLLLRKKKEGLGAAYLAGMREAFGKLKAEVCLILDSDLSHNPDSIPAFLAEIEKGADFVIGSRYIKGGAIAKNWALHRKFFSVFGNLTTSLFLGQNGISDWTSGYRAIKRKVFEKVAPKVSDKREFKGYTFNISFAYHTIDAGFKVAQVPIKFVDRKSGKSKLGFEYLLNTPIFLVKTKFGKLFNRK